MPFAEGSGPGRPDDRWFGRCLAVVALVALIQLAVRPAITYRVLDTGLDVVWVGGLAAVFNLGPLVLTVPVGRWMDAGRQRPAAVLSAIGLAVATAGFALLGGLIALIACSLIAGTAILMLNAVTQSLIAVRSPVERYESRFALFALAGSGGQAAGGALVSAAPLITPDLTSTVFWTCCGAAVLMMAVVAALRGTRPSRPSRTAPAARPSVRRVLGAPGVRTSMVASLLVVATIDLFAVFLPLLGLERGYSALLVGALITTRALATVAARVVMPWLSRRLGSGRLFGLSVLGAAVAVAAVAIPAPAPVALAVCALAGLLLGFGQPLSMAMVARLAPADSRGLAMSLRMSGNMAGLATLPLAVSPVIASVGVGAGFLVTAGLVAAAGVAVLRIRS